MLESAGPLVSVIIPCHNAAPWLAATLESALAQTWPHREIILVDDGSTDESRRIARPFAARGVRLIEQPNRGASAARNVGLRESHGDWIQFLDADDLLAPDKLELQLDLAAAIGPAFALCGTWHRFTSSIAAADHTPQPLCTDAAPVDWLVTKLEHHRMMHPAAWLLHRALIERAGPWNEALSLDDDGEYFARVVLASDGVRCCRAAISYYRSQVPGSLSGRRSEDALASGFTALAQSTARLLDVENSPRTRRACATALQRYIYEAYPRARSCRRRAADLVRRYGGSELQPEGGPRFQRARRWLGWRLAKRLQSL